MSGRPGRTDDTELNDNNLSPNSNSRFLSATNSYYNDAQQQQQQRTGANQTDAEADIRRRQSTTSSIGNRRLSKLSFSNTNNNNATGEERTRQHHHHHIRAVPQSQYNFKPFTRESLAAIEEKIAEENARKLLQQAQTEVNEHRKYCINRKLSNNKMCFNISRVILQTFTVPKVINNRRHWSQILCWRLAYHCLVGFRESSHQS